MPEITFEAKYLNADTDSRTFQCGSVSEIPARYLDRRGADGTIARSIIEPRCFRIAGIDSGAVEALGWGPNRLLLKDSETGELKEFMGDLRDTMEPNTVLFALAPAG